MLRLVFYLLPLHFITMLKSLWLLDKVISQCIGSKEPFAALELQVADPWIPGPRHTDHLFCTDKNKGVKKSAWLKQKTNGAHTWL